MTIAHVLRTSFALLFSLVSCSATSAEIVAAGYANGVVEVTFTAEQDYADPFNDVMLDLIVTDPQGNTKRLPAYWAGGNEWRGRYSSPIVGTHHVRTECNQPNDKGLQGVSRELAIAPYAGDNPLYIHGPLRVATDRRTLEHADGTPFFWLADTWWMGLSGRLQRDEARTLADDRRAKGFNVVQIVMGPPPDSHPFDPRSANGGGFAWEAGYAAMRPEYYDEADQKINDLLERGFVPCMVGMWGYHIEFMGVERAKQHWRYLIARYGAMPVVWCAAGEANLPWYLAAGFPFDDREQVTEWTEVLRYIRETDPYHRLLTIHPTGFGWSARYATDDVKLLDFDLLQTPHGQRDAVDTTVGKIRESYAAATTMPVIDGEAAYEMINDSLPTRWTRQMFWLCMTNGAAGHTYGANGIWQCNRPGDPHGPSPQHPAGGTGYGTIPWNEAMRLPGSTQVGLGKKLFEQFEWWKFRPAHDSVGYANGQALQPSQWGEWIWFSEGKPQANAPLAKRFFRKAFELSANASIKRGTLWLAVDDRGVASINGQQVATTSDWRSPAPVDVTSRLKPGRNVLAVEGENLAGQVTANPAGLMACLEVEFADGQKVVVQSDETWRSAQELGGETSAWTTADFEDSQWQPAARLANYGEAPWDAFGQPATYGPYATGIEGAVRVIYVPESRPIEVRSLAPGAAHTAYVFDPVSGKQIDLGPLTPDGQGVAVVAKPALDSDAEDWVLVIQSR
jgi:hypothetical protein